MPLLVAWHVLVAGARGQPSMHPIILNCRYYALPSKDGFLPVCRWQSLEPRGPSFPVTLTLLSACGQALFQPGRAHCLLRHPRSMDLHPLPHPGTPSRLQQAKPPQTAHNHPVRALSVNRPLALATGLSLRHKPSSSTLLGSHRAAAACSRSPLCHPWLRRGSPQQPAARMGRAFRPMHHPG